MTDCRNATADWGSICPTCGQRLPSPSPLESWKSNKERLLGDEHQRRLNSMTNPDRRAHRRTHA